MATRKRVESWVVTDDFWQRVEPLIPAADTGAVRWDCREVFDATGDTARLRQAVIALGGWLRSSI